LIVMHEKTAVYKTSKPVLCPKCERGKLGYIPEKTETAISRRGKPPTEEQDDYVQVKCFICRSDWPLTIQ
jgi:hypothetical protein